LQILITIPNLKDPGGVASYYNSILPYLHTSCDINIITHQIGSSHSKFSLFHSVLDQFRFIKKIIFQRFDIVHINPSLNFKSYLRDGLFTFWAKIMKKNVLVFFHGWEDYFFNNISGLLNFFFNMTYKKADLFIVLASDFRTKLRSKGITQPIQLMTTAVDEVLMQDFSIETKIDHMKLSGCSRILFLSRLEKEKGFFESIDACKLLVDQGYDIYLTVAGDGPAKQEAENYLRELGLQHRFKMAGYVKGRNKQETFANHDIFCFPTNFGEGMPNAVLEAMAFGMPVVTRAVGGLKDFFENGKMGYLVETTNPEEIACGLKNLLDNEQNYYSISEYNYNYAQEHFMASKVAAKLYNLYEQLTPSDT